MDEFYSTHFTQFPQVEQSFINIIIVDIHFSFSSIIRSRIQLEIN